MVKGLTAESRRVANSMTLAGYAGAVARTNANRGRGLRRANLAFQTALRAGPIGPTAYQRAGGLAGLGDAIDDFSSDEFWDEVGPHFAPDVDVEPAPQEGGSWWTDVLQTFAGQVGLGVAGRVAGQNPWARPVVVPPTEAVPGWVKFGLIAVGVGGGAYILTRMARR